MMPLDIFPIERNNKINKGQLNLLVQYVNLHVNLLSIKNTKK